jgi:hypothetical protein
LIGEDRPDGDGTGEVYLLDTPDTRKSEALRTQALQGGPREYTFSLPAVAPGTYYLEACLRFAAGTGCAPYSTDPAGNPTAVRVYRGQTTQAQIRF